MWRRHFGLGAGVVGSNPILIKATVAQRCVPYVESKCEIKWWRGMCVFVCREWSCPAVIMQLFYHQPTPLSFPGCWCPVVISSLLSFTLFGLYYFPFIPVTLIFLDPLSSFCSICHIILPVLFLLPYQINCHSVAAHLCENFRQFSVHLIKCFSPLLSSRLHRWADGQIWKQIQYSFVGGESSHHPWIQTQNYRGQGDI